MIFFQENAYIDNINFIKAIKYNLSLQPYFDSSYDKIKPKTNYCGFLSIAGESYFILPKIVNEESQNQNIFIYMILYAHNIKLKNEDLINANNQKHHIFEIFIKFFSDRLLGQLKKGLFKQYISQEENLKVLRGKYIIEKNFVNFYHQNLYCEFDDFSMDNDLNQFFLYAIKTFNKFSSTANLYKCEVILDEVSYKNIDINKLTIHFDRMNIRYKKSYEIALMILQSLVPMTEKSTDKSFAFLFDMAKVFERFVEKIYQEIDPSCKSQYSKSFGKLHLRPDIYIEKRIIDIKYKSYDNHGIKRDDKYQMFVYGKNFKIKDTMIIYPKHKNDVNENLELGEGDEMVHLALRSLDLGFDGGYDGFICEIKKRLEGMR